MIEFKVSRKELLPPLLTVSSVAGKKSSNPLLAHLLLDLTPHQLVLTATDLDIQITARVPCETAAVSGSITVPAKKMVDIIRSLDEEAVPSFQFDEGSASIRVGRSYFKLTTLPAAHFPSIQDEPPEVELNLPVQELTQLLQSTHFALSQQDVRVFLNCLLLEFEQTQLIAVGTDGHRMAIARTVLSTQLERQRLLIPRKAIQEILRLIQPVLESTLTLSAGKKYLRLVTQQYTFCSKLVEARFPQYVKAIPTQHNKHVVVDRDALKRALTRIIILTHEKSRAILLHIQPGLITLVANNQEKEEAIDSLDVETQGDELKIGVNAVYLLDVLNVINEGPVHLSFSTAECSILLETPSSPHYQYIIMPMKL
jgi:DNA polymerase-3 subunit beta